MAAYNVSSMSNHTMLHLATLRCQTTSLDCPVEATVYGYRPSIVANAVFASLFAICAVLQTILAFYSNTWMYCRFVALACIIETVGYIARLMLWSNPWSSIGFKIQVSMLIIGPAFLAAAVYITLKSIIRRLTPEAGDLPHCSPLKPVIYTPLFISCDATCGLLQAAGGAVAAAAGTETAQLSMGGNIMLAGIATQVAVSLSFIVLVAVYAFRVYRNRHYLPLVSLALLRSLRFRLFLAGLTVSFSTVFIRCVFRIAEMADGWGNPIMRDEPTFIALDGVMCALAAISLTVCHPAWCFRGVESPITKEVERK